MLDNAWYVRGSAGVNVVPVGSATGVSGATVAMGSIYIPAGATIIVLVNENAATAAGSLSDGGSNTYSIKTSGAVNTAAGFATVFFAYNAVALVNATLTFTRQNSASAVGMTAFYITGLKTASDPTDSAFTASAVGASVNPSITSGTPSQANEIVIGLLAYNSSAGVAYTTQPNSVFIGGTTTQSRGSVVASLYINGSAAPMTYFPALGSSQNFIGFVLAFAQATAPSAGWYGGVTPWAASTSYAAGVLRRQLGIPTINNERVFACIVAGTSGGTEPTWVVTRGGKTTDNTVTWQECTGVAALNGDTASTPTWSTAGIKNTAITLGQVIYDPGSASVQICSTAGTAGNAATPSFSATAGVTTADNTVTWTSLGLASGFTIWKSPFSRLIAATAASWGAAGNNFYCAADHIELGIVGPTLPSGVFTPSFAYCVANSPGSVPPGAADVTTGANITAINNAIGTGGLYAFFNGITFQQNVVAANNMSIGNTGQGLHRFDNCSFNNISLLGTQTILGTANPVVLNNCQFLFSFPGQALQALFHPIVRGGGFAAGSVAVTTALTVTSSVGIFEGFDFSLCTGTLVANNTNQSWYAMFLRCKIAAGVIQDAGFSRTDQMCDFIQCDSGATTYTDARYVVQGSQTQSNALSRVGGASDGVTPLSWQIATSAINFWQFPFESQKIAGWNGTTGSNRTVTVFGVVNAAAVPNNDHIWIDVDYLGSASSPLASIVNSSKANALATAAALTADTSDWTAGTVAARANTTAYSLGNAIKLASNPGRVFFCITAGTSAGSEPGGYASAVDGGSVTDGGATFRAGCRFKMAVTLSSPQPQMAGYIYTTVKAALPSTTYFVDPLAVVS